MPELSALQGKGFSSECQAACGHCLPRQGWALGLRDSHQRSSPWGSAGREGAAVPCPNPQLQVNAMGHLPASSSRRKAHLAYQIKPG